MGALSAAPPAHTMATPPHPFPPSDRGTVVGRGARIEGEVGSPVAVLRRFRFLGVLFCSFWGLLFPFLPPFPRCAVKSGSASFGPGAASGVGGWVWLEGSFPVRCVPTECWQDVLYGLGVFNIPRIWCVGIAVLARLTSQI